MSDEKAARQFTFEAVQRAHPRMLHSDPIDTLEEAQALASKASEPESVVEVRLYEHDAETSLVLVEVYRKGARS